MDGGTAAIDMLITCDQEEGTVRSHPNGSAGRGSGNQKWVETVRRKRSLVSLGFCWFPPPKTPWCLIEIAIWLQFSQQIVCNLGTIKASIYIYIIYCKASKPTWRPMPFLTWVHFQKFVINSVAIMRHTMTVIQRSTSIMNQSLSKTNHGILTT